MGMASSDNEAEIMRRHGRDQHIKSRPRNPNTYEHRASEDANAYYLHDLAEWAEGLSQYDEPNGGYLA